MKELRQINGIKTIINEPKKEALPVFLDENAANEVRKFHKTMNEYQVTPMVTLDNLAKKIGLRKIFVKDESFRFGLKAFKAIGGSYAIAKVLCKELGVDIANVDFAYFKSEEIHNRIKDMIFVTATDGNHGKGIAWSATQLGCKSVVYMPKGSSLNRLKAIQEAGAEASITEHNYDDTVRYAAKMAEKNGWYLMQDTSWDGYEEIPNWITQGYLTMADEALEQIAEYGIEKPTHVFLQAGVGSMASGVLGYYRNKFKQAPPKAIILESDKASCIYESMAFQDGEPHPASGNLNTIMAGLACGEPSIVAWKIIRDLATGFISCEDYITMHGMRLAAKPVEGDPPFVSGESGAVGLGLISVLCEKPECREIREALGLDEKSVVLLFSTEGDTDPESYKEIVACR